MPTSETEQLELGALVAVGMGVGVAVAVLAGAVGVTTKLAWFSVTFWLLPEVTRP